ncbi:MAG: hypothetical protein HZT40_09525 [Candidatus Thiothrix singaporensis]|uniref:Uncharacterized protein n=1 Tax=Candidatus Thiothrix singaporensis TaxID=2799669 RepID=A0A7L6ARP5_9GAMM|nr:MAG: hypothetical protein HZT40_09525 [Candidatus Thiothrix singaporensis]
MLAGPFAMAIDQNAQNAADTAAVTKGQSIVANSTNLAVNQRLCQVASAAAVQLDSKDPGYAEAIRLSVQKAVNSVTGLIPPNTADLNFSLGDCGISGFLPSSAAGATSAQRGLLILGLAAAGGWHFPVF